MNLLFLWLFVFRTFDSSGIADQCTQVSCF